MRLERADNTQPRDKQRPASNRHAMPPRQHGSNQRHDRHAEHSQNPERPLLEVALHERVVCVKDPLRVGIDLVLHGDAVSGIHAQSDTRQRVLDEQPGQIAPIGQPPSG